MALCVFNAVEAGSPVWVFTPLTATTISVQNNDTATVQYQVTNQSTRSHTLVMNDITGVTQITSGVGVCAKPFTLSGHSSCTLILQIDGSQITAGNTDGPVVCEQGNQLQCYRPNSADTLNVDVTYAPNTTTLSVTPSTLTLSVTGLTTTTGNNSGTPPSAEIADTSATPITLTIEGTNTNTLSPTVNVLTYGSFYQAGWLFSIIGVVAANRRNFRTIFNQK